jgi:hypothetical protein
MFPSKRSAGLYPGWDWLYPLLGGAA